MNRIKHGRPARFGTWYRSKYRCLDHACGGNLRVSLVMLGTITGYCARCKRDYFVDRQGRIHRIKTGGRS